MVLYFRDMDIREEARKEAKAEQKKEMVRSMLAEGLSVEQIKRIASITEEELEVIQAEQDNLQ